MDKDKCGNESNAEDFYEISNVKYSYVSLSFT